MVRLRLGTTILATLALLAAFMAPAVHADDGDPRAERAVESLHPFGVRGLPGAYEGCARVDERKAAIARGLAWLTAHQADDGSWRPHELGWCNGKHDESKAPKGKGQDFFTVGVTGMTAAAYLGAGHTHRGKHANDVALRKALTWLVKQQDKEGCVGPRRTQMYVYEHAFATLALVEAYALTGDKHLQAPAQKALDFSARARNPNGGWRYGVQPGDNDTSLTGCMGMPLYVASRLNNAGLRAGLIDPLSVDDSAFDGIRIWLDTITDDYSGRAGYVQRGTGPARPAELVDAFPGENSESCTAIAMLMRQLLPSPRATKKQKEFAAAMNAKGVKLLLELLPTWRPGKGTIDLYYWYYGTMAMRQTGGEAWTTWDAAVSEALFEGQSLTGDVCGTLGSWEPESVWSKSDGGRIYATAIALLTLETPDRMRPIPEDRSDLLQALAAGIEDTHRLASVVRGIGVLRVRGGGDAVAPYVKHTDGEVVAAAAEALEHLEAGPESVKLLGSMLGDTRVEVRRAVVRALAAQGKGAAPLVAALGERLADADAEVASTAARALGLTGSQDAAPLLSARLEGGSPALRVAAASALHRLTGDTATTRPVLLVGLAHADASVRVVAAGALERQSPDIADAEAALTKALKDADMGVVIHAAGALHKAGKQKEACVAAWIAALDAGEARLRLEAMDRLQAAGSARAVPKLTVQLMDGPTTLRVKCARALCSLGQAARPAAAQLCWCSVNGPKALRSASSEAFDALALDAAAAKKHMLDGFQVEDRRIVEGTVEALVRVGAPAVSVVLQKLATGDAPTRAWMLEALRRLGPDAAASVADVGRLVESADDPKIRWRAARVLAAIGPAAAPALGALEFALQHEKEYVRQAAMEAIGVIAPGSPDAQAALRRIASDTDKKNVKLRAEALRAMGGLGKDGEDMLPVLMAGLDAAPGDVRAASVQSLVALFEHVEKELAKHVDDDSVRVRDGIAQVVEVKGEEAKRFAKPLAKSLENRAPSGNSKTADALAAIGKPAVGTLMKLLKSKKGPVRGEAARALGKIGPDAKRAIKQLERLTRDPDWGVQMKAQAALERIRGGS